MSQEKSLAVFQGKKIRRVWYDGEWYFSVVDAVEALTDSPTPRQYWGKVKGIEFTPILEKLPGSQPKLLYSNL